ncbi:hypothetical protein M6B38_127550 [Iris pallida]|uniref:Secreted protein n=1 Tax=Iris pallida TaxID=29817 RepID=A0AAX6G5S1_IRIPA|nr:hypothetical protein M6B38_127550 [Iris pallida]
MIGKHIIIIIILFLNFGQICGRDVGDLGCSCPAVSCAWPGAVRVQPVCVSNDVCVRPRLALVLSVVCVPGLTSCWCRIQWTEITYGVGGVFSCSYIGEVLWTSELKQVASRVL